MAANCMKVPTCENEVTCDTCLDIKKWQEYKAMLKAAKPGDLVELPKGVSPLDVQIGGDHYKKAGIQPIEYILANNLGFVEGNVVKYVSRWKDKGGVEDLKKARHYLDMLIEHMEKTNG